MMSACSYTCDIRVLSINEESNVEHPDADGDPPALDFGWHSKWIGLVVLNQWHIYHVYP